MAYSSEWTDNLKSDKDRDEFRTMLSSSIPLKRLNELVDKYLAEVDRRDLNDDYTSPAWPYQQADRLGQFKALQKIKRLLTA